MDSVILVEDSRRFGVLVYTAEALGGVEVSRLDNSKGLQGKGQRHLTRISIEVPSSDHQAADVKNWETEALEKDLDQKNGGAFHSEWGRTTFVLSSGSS